MQPETCIPGRRQTRGQGLVEFALILPLLLGLVLGIVEVGRLLTIFSSMSSAARQAVRYGSVGGDNGSGTIYYLDCAGMRAVVQGTGRFIGITSGNIQIAYQRPVTSTGNFAQLGACDVSNAARLNNGTLMTANDVLQGSRVVLTVTASYQPLVALVKLPSFPITFVAARSIFPNIEGPTPTPKPPPDLTVQITDSPDPTTVNTNVQYVIGISNTSAAGTRLSTGPIVLTQTIPTGWVYNAANNTSATIGSGWSCPSANVNGGGVITCTLSTNILPLSMRYLTVTLTSPTSLGVNTDFTTRVGIVYRTTATQSATATTTVAVGSDLIISKVDAADPILPGGIITYLVTITNQLAVATGASQQIKVEDALPAGVSYIGMTRLSGNGAWTCSNIAGKATCTSTNANLSLNQAVQFRLLVTAPGSNAIIANSAQVSMPGGSESVTTNNDSGTITTTVRDAADVSITEFMVEDGADLKIGPTEQITYTLRVFNAGPRPATGLVVNFPASGAIQGYPTHLASVSFAGTNGADWNCVLSANAVTCTYLPASLAVGGTASDIRIILTAANSIPSELVVLHDATVSTTIFDSNLSNNTASVAGVTIKVCRDTYIIASSSVITQITSAANPAIVQAASDAYLTVSVNLYSECGTAVANKSVTLLSSRPGSEIISLTPGGAANSTGTTNGVGNITFYVRSTTPLAPAAAASTYSAVAYNGATPVNLPTAAGSPAARYVCVDGTDPDYIADSTSIYFNFANNTGLARKLIYLEVAAAGVGGNKKMSTVTFGPAAASIWTASGNIGKTSPIQIGTGGAAAFTAGADVTLASGSNKDLVLYFNFNVSGAYTVITKWSDNAGASICQSLPVTINR